MRIIWTYEKYLCMVQFLYNKFIDSHLWFIILHNTTSCTCRLYLFRAFRMHFHRKGETSKSLLVASIMSIWQHSEYLTQDIFQSAWHMIKYSPFLQEILKDVVSDREHLVF